MHFNIYDVFYSLNSPQYVLAAIVAIFRVMLLLEEYKVQIWLDVSLSLHAAEKPEFTAAL